MYISKLRIKNYKSFLDSGYIDFKENIFAFIGQNNTGKSAILDSIQAFFPTCKKGISGEDFHNGTKEDIVIELWFKNVDEPYLEANIYKDKIDKQNEKINEAYDLYNKENTDTNLKKYETQKEKLIEIKTKELNEAIEKYGIDNEELYIKMVAKKGSSINKKYYNKNDEELKEADLKKILPQIKVIPALRDPKNESTAGNNSYLKDLIQMLDDESKTDIILNDKPLTYSELNNVLSQETKKRCNDLAQTITSYYNDAIGSKDFKIVIDASVNISKGTQYTTTIIDTTTGISNDILNCGTGYQSMIILSILEAYVQISQSNTQYILLIEEPEVYLHPRLQRKMIDTLLKISENNQVIFSSHSPITVSKLASNNIRLVEKNNGETKVLSISPKKVIDELGIKPDDILYSKGIIFVEGKDDIEIISELIRKIDENMVDKINIIQAHSCENLKFYANTELLINTNFSVPVLILRDADIKKPDVLRDNLYEEIAFTLLNEPQYANFDEKDLEYKKEKLKESIHVLNEHSIEYYFIENNFLQEFASDNIELEYAIKCYECQYRKQLEEAINGNNQKNNFESCFQPKRFLEGFPDVKERDREKKEQSLKNRWFKLSESCNCTNDYKIDNYLKVRDEIIKNIKQFYIEGNNFYQYIIRSNDLNILKRGKLKEIIILLERFIEKMK
ncbi:AAA family ATPase [Thermoanaerobacterium sp. CMT5567-10]|uniref:ATP-dependent nuclease n=1 Tax=Thermoanaerobacterium sp. CMT5567-10 TaxID=3061989 RepID=UPI0026E0277E|nr:AAA family ATPase [Thermoanaerobacterium sp. CMT5567-10]WKV08065.1 AAA family ATPase [Thermoanaerobacterium sp. CMT5567-10]